MTLRPKKKIGICHYRIGLTDGVSLEISKRKKVLESLGYQVKLISGPRQINADHIIKELEFDLPSIIKIKENAFFDFKNYKRPPELMNDIYRTSNKIKNKFLAIHKKENFDYLFLHNIFSHGRHISAAKAFYEIACETKIKIIAVNHDFYNTYEGLYTPRLKEIKQYLATYVPPKLKNIRHVTINSISQEICKKLCGQASIIFPDTFDFDQPKWEKDTYNKSFLPDFKIKENDLIILQATRIVERKAIEIAIDLTRELEKKKKSLIGKKLYNGKKIDKNSKIIMVFAGFIEPASKKYGQILKQKIKREKINARFVGNKISHKRSLKKNKKIYSLWDAYVYADLVTFPSTWEGWGNQFIEAVFAEKPIVVFEYPVFKKDIKKEGYQIISLGNTFVRKNKLATINKNKLLKTADDTIQNLLGQKTKNILKKNFKIGDKFHGQKALKKYLKQCLE